MARERPRAVVCNGQWFHLTADHKGYRAKRGEPRFTLAQLKKKFGKCEEVKVG